MTIGRAVRTRLERVKRDRRHYVTWRRREKAFGAGARGDFAGEERGVMGEGPESARYGLEREA